MSEYVTIWVDDLPDLKRGEEIVRCRACKHYEPRVKDGVCHRSKFIPLYAMDNGFCAWGKVDA